MKTRVLAHNCSSDTKARRLSKPSPQNNPGLFRPGPLCALMDAYRAVPVRLWSALARFTSPQVSEGLGAYAPERLKLKLYIYIINVGINTDINVLLLNCSSSFLKTPGALGASAVHAACLASTCSHNEALRQELQVNCAKKSPPSAEAKVDEVQNMDLAPNTKPQRRTSENSALSLPPKLPGSIFWASRMKFSGLMS